MLQKLLNLSDNLSCINFIRRYIDPVLPQLIVLKHLFCVLKAHYYYSVHALSCHIRHA